LVLASHNVASNDFPSLVDGREANDSDLGPTLFSWISKKIWSEFGASKGANITYRAWIRPGVVERHKPDPINSK